VLFKRNGILTNDIIVVAESSNMVGICDQLSLCSGVKDCKGNYLADEDLIIIKSLREDDGKHYAHRVRYNGEYWSYQVGDSSMQQPLKRIDKHLYFLVGSMSKQWDRDAYMDGHKFTAPENW
jgi:hypothetical protein